MRRPSNIEIIDVELGDKGNLQTALCNIEDGRDFNYQANEVATKLEVFGVVGPLPGTNTYKAICRRYLASDV